MEATVLQIANAYEALNQLSNTPLEAATSFKIYSMKSAMEDTAQNYNKTKNDLIMTSYGIEHPKNSGNYTVPHWNIEQYTEEMKPIEEKVVKVEAETVNMGELQGVKISPSFFSLMGPFLEK